MSRYSLKPAVSGRSRRIPDPKEFIASDRKTGFSRLSLRRSVPGPDSRLVPDHIQLEAYRALCKKRNGPSTKGHHLNERAFCNRAKDV
jgi:hypothetical protein